MTHKHFRQRNHICMDCGAPLCTHQHARLRGCLLDRGHDGPHFNPNSNDDLTWTDADGLYIGTHEDWVRLVNYLGNPDSPFPGSNHPKGQTLEQALTEAAEAREEVFRQSAISEALEKKRKH